MGLAMSLPGGSPPSVHLRYIDFISPQEAVQPILASAENLLAFPCTIDTLPAPPHQSGPRAEEAVSTFQHGIADIGRM